MGDTFPTSAPTVGAVPAFGDVTSTAAGTAGDLAGTIASDCRCCDCTAGGANTLAIGQVISELTTGEAANHSVAVALVGNGFARRSQTSARVWCRLTTTTKRLSKSQSFQSPIALALSTQSVARA